MKWLSLVCEDRPAPKALETCIRQTREAAGDSPDLSLLFVNTAAEEETERLLETAKKLLAPKTLLGCSASGIIGGGQEIEDRPAVGLICAWLPGVRVFPFRLTQKDLPSPDDPPKAWSQLIGVMNDRAMRANFILLSDPFSINPETLAQGLDYAYPGSVKIGGLASRGRRPGENALFLDRESRPAGAVGVALTGNLVVDPIVAQGCRPVGRPYKVTQCEDNVLAELDDRRIPEIFEELFASLSEKDRELAGHSLFLGILNNPLKAISSAKDYLIRNLIGFDPERGLLSVSALLRPGQIIQFHIRDKETSAKDLQRHLEEYKNRNPGIKPEGALLFSCTGRGRGLYGRPNHDSEIFADKMGPLALGGFFANGEIGPVDNATHIHGYTSCFGLFRPTH
ncbi:MAG: FIST C-terminal domain-containing protein [Elusimicrobia bacterium]|nr:FIST C-terminal domain-containing protein [Elusimicrobiota bacterium]